MVIEQQAEIIQFLIHVFIANHQFKPLCKQRSYALITLLQQSCTALVQQRFCFRLHLKFGQGDPPPFTGREELPAPFSSAFWGAGAPTRNAKLPIPATQDSSQKIHCTRISNTALLSFPKIGCLAADMHVLGALLAVLDKNKHSPSLDKM